MLAMTKFWGLQVLSNDMYSVVHVYLGTDVGICCAALRFFFFSEAHAHRWDSHLHLHCTFFFRSSCYEIPRPVGRRAVRFFLTSPFYRFLL